CRYCPSRGCRKREVPCFNPSIGGQMLASVVMRNNHCPGIVHPFIPIGVVEVPVCVDEVLDRIGADDCECVADPRARTEISGVNQKLTVATRQNPDISSCAHNHAYVAAQLL